MRLWVCVILVLTACWMLMIEPFWLEITHTTIRTAKVHRSYRLVVLADIQTARLGKYEKSVLRKVMAENPDIILFAGDYLHTYSHLKERTKEFNDFLKEINLRAPLGIYAVRGNEEADSWPQLFAGLGVKTNRGIKDYHAGELTITTGDAVWWSAPAINRSRVDGFRVVLAHHPDIALSRVNADLIVAGHVHGGQVRLPFIGPLITLSKIPRAWATGLTVLPDGNLLYVSRGIGVVRGVAPPIRFNCRPELAVIDVIPR